MLKQHLVALMMASSDDRIAMLLLDSISLISQRPLDKEWPSLLPELVFHVQEENPQTLSRVMYAFKQICKKYRFLSRSVDLCSELIATTTSLSPHLLQILCVSLHQETTQLN